MEEIELRWSRSVIDKIIRRHAVTPEEVEEIIYERRSLLRRGTGSGRNRRYYVFGQTLAGRYTFVVLKRVHGTVFSTITARDMKDDEKKLYKRCVG